LTSRIMDAIFTQLQAQVESSRSLNSLSVAAQVR
jgi:hypothetical protein